LRIDVVYDTDDEFAMKCRGKALKQMLAGSVTWRRQDSRNVLIEFSHVNVPVDIDSLPDLARAFSRAAGSEGGLDAFLKDVDSLETAFRQVAESLIGEQFKQEVWFAEQRAFPVHEPEKAPKSREWNVGAKYRNEDCAWVDGDNGQLPHEVNGTVVWRGVVHAMIRLLVDNSVEIPAGDKLAVYRHLSAHYNQFEQTPPTLKFEGGERAVEWHSNEQEMYPSLFEERGEDDTGGSTVSSLSEDGASGIGVKPALAAQITAIGVRHCGEHELE
jgi:hypothetical protein